MQVEKSRLGLEGDTKVDIVDVKCNPDMVGLLTQTYGFLPGYHMNKKYWIAHAVGRNRKRSENLRLFGYEL